MNIKALFKRDTQIGTDKRIDQAYVAGSFAERHRILSMIDRLIYANRGIDSVTALARQISNTLKAKE